MSVISSFSENLGIINDFARLSRFWKTARGARFCTFLRAENYDRMLNYLSKKDVLTWVALALPCILPTTTSTNSSRSDTTRMITKGFFHIITVNDVDDHGETL